MTGHSFRLLCCRRVYRFSATCLLHFTLHPILMNSIELLISSTRSSTFGIQSVAVAYESSGTSQGCNVNNADDCRAACQDPNQIFSNPYTLQNCLVLSALAPNALAQTSDSNLTLSGEFSKIASKFAINTTSLGFQNPASNVTQTVKGCLEDYGMETQSCTAPYSQSPPWYSPQSSKTTNTTGIPVSDVFHGGHL